MPRYTVCIDEIHTIEYTVDAENPSAAIRKVAEGGTDPGEGVWLEGDECRGPQTGAMWWVEEKYPDINSPTPTQWDLVDEYDLSWINPGS